MMGACAVVAGACGSCLLTSLRSGSREGLETPGWLSSSLLFSDWIPAPSVVPPAFRVSLLPVADSFWKKANIYTPSVSQ